MVPIDANTLYEQYAQEVYRYAMFKLGRRELAEDVTSETFARLIAKENIKTDNIKLWLITTARNIVYEQYRDQKKHSVGTELTDVLAGTTESALTTELLISLQTELTNMNPELSEIITLKTWDELRFEDIAQITDSNVNTVKAKYYKAVSELTTKLNATQKDQKVRVVTVPLLLSGIAHLAKGLSPTPEFSGVLRTTYANKATNLIVKSKEMSGISQIFVQHKIAVLFSTVVATTVVSVGVTLAIVGNSVPPQQPQQTEQSTQTQQPEQSEEVLTEPEPVCTKQFSSQYVDLSFEYDSCTWEMSEQILVPEQGIYSQITATNKSGEKLTIDGNTLGMGGGYPYCYLATDITQVTDSFARVLIDENYIYLNEANEYGIKGATGVHGDSKYQWYFTFLNAEAFPDTNVCLTGSGTSVVAILNPSADRTEVWQKKVDVIVSIPTGNYSSGFLTSADKIALAVYSSIK